MQYRCVRASECMNLVWSDLALQVRVLFVLLSMLSLCSQARFSWGK